MGGAGRGRVLVVKNWWTHSKTVILIWSICIFLSFSILHMALKYSNNPPPSPSDANEQRSRLYDKMARDLDEKGLAFLKHGETSQSLSLSDIFTFKDESVTPVLRVPMPLMMNHRNFTIVVFFLAILVQVLASFYRLQTLLSELMYCTSVQITPCQSPIWFQNSSLYHFSMFHASHHITPVPVTEEEVEAEATAVRAVAEGLCPLKIVLDRVVLTSTGVLMGCWQVISGTDPTIIRAILRAALPRAPEKQLYEASILHTSFARLLGPPKASTKESLDQLQLLHELVAHLDKKIHGFEATVSELWYVEEYDVLALALNGKMEVRQFQVGCRRA